MAGEREARGINTEPPDFQPVEPSHAAQNRQASPLRSLCFSLGRRAHASRAPRSRSSPFGINIHAPQGEELTALLDRVQAAGSAGCGSTSSGPGSSRSRDQYDWRLYDAIVAAARARGIEVFASLAYTPAWATAGPARHRRAGRSADMGRLLRPRPPTLPRQDPLSGGCGTSPTWTSSGPAAGNSTWTCILKPGADAIHAANPDGPGRRPGSGAPDLRRQRLVRLAARDRARPEDELDFVTHHVYDSDGNRRRGRQLDGSTLFGNRPVAVGTWSTRPSRRCSRNAGWYRAPGLAHRDRLGVAARSARTDQASWHERPAQRLAHRPPNRSWIDKIFFYELADGPPPGAAWGLLRGRPLAPRPAYDAYTGLHRCCTQRRRTTPRRSARHVPSTLAMEAGQPVTVTAHLPQHRHHGLDGRRRLPLGAAERSAIPSPIARQLARGGRAASRPEQQKTFIFELTAPPTPGTYTDPTGRCCARGPTASAPRSQRQIRVVRAAVAERDAPPDERPASRSRSAWRDPAAAAPASAARCPARTRPASSGSSIRRTSSWWSRSSTAGRSTGSFWVFYGALSDVEYWVDVTEKRTGRTKHYHNPPGSLCGRGDTSAFSGRDGRGRGCGRPSRLSRAPSLEHPADSRRPPSLRAACRPQTLCLLGDRFRVSVELADPRRHRPGAASRSAVRPTGTFWFFGPETSSWWSRSWTARPVNGKLWFFYGALSDVQYTITVLDTVTGVGSLPQPGEPLRQGGYRRVLRPLKRLRSRGAAVLGNHSRCAG